MISVTKDTAENALDEIDRGLSLAVPQKRRSTKHCLLARDKHYPPKYVVMLAYLLQNGAKPEGLSGGDPSNEPLRNLGYEIKENCRCGNNCNFIS